MSVCAARNSSSPGEMARVIVSWDQCWLLSERAYRKVYTAIVDNCCYVSVYTSMRAATTAGTRSPAERLLGCIPLSLNSFGSSLFGLMLKADEVLDTPSSGLSPGFATPFVVGRLFSSWMVGLLPLTGGTFLPKGLRNGGIMAECRVMFGTSAAERLPSQFNNVMLVNAASIVK